MFGRAEVVNTRRYYRLVGWQNDEFGKPFIADRIRTLKIEQRFTIAPPVIYEHNVVKLHTRYVEPRGWDSYRTGGHYLQIHWTIITPRWNLQHFFGYPALRNLTPELKIFGHDSQEFGDTHLRTQWREVFPRETWSQAFGKPLVEYRTKKVFVRGFPTLFFSDRAWVRRLGPEPVLPIKVWVQGIPVPQPRQFGTPYMNYRFLYPGPVGDNMVFGEPDLRAMSIRPVPGCAAPWPGIPTVWPKLRRVYAEGWHSNNPYEIPISGHGDPNRLRVTPHTIYAPSADMASEQAKRNHPAGSPHVINEHDKWRLPQQGMGEPSVVHQHRRILVRGHQDSRFTAYPADLVNRTHWVRVEGFRNYRAGVHKVLSGVPRFIDLDEEGIPLRSRPGEPALTIDTTGWPRTFHAPSFDSAVFGATDVQNQHRPIYPHGFYATQMGESGSDSPRQWQRRAGDRRPK